MKALHRDDLYGWSTFDTARNLDFHGTLWVRPEGNVVIDPVALTDHDARHLDALGGAAWVIVTNSDHVRATRAVVERTGARVAGPAAEREAFPVACDRWLTDGEELVAGLTVFELEGSKTPGELAVLIGGHTLVTGDLVRAHRAGSLAMLPEAKPTDRAKALASVRRLADIPGVEAVLVGDGWPVFRDGGARLREIPGVAVGG